ncbi:MAG: phosphohistidine phosphatase SixA [Terrimicrobiaceae bacterium]
MIVYFLRHADAEPDAGNDFDRKLTPKGLEQAAKVGKFLVRNGLLPEAIVSSPVVRARQTAEAVEKKLGQASVVIGSWLACGMTPETCLTELSVHAGTNSLLLVGHEPDFSDTIAALLGLANPDALNIRKASLTGIELSGFAAGAGRLQLLVPVRLM